jgi:hypothetical protein
MKQLIILIIIFPLITFGQIEKSKYEIVIGYIVDSIIKNDLGKFHISNSIARKTEFADFHGLSENCEIQHKLLLEILLKGEQSKIKESKLAGLIPGEYKIESNNRKVEFGTIITYKNIWATVIIIRNNSTQEDEWTKHSLLFIDNKLIGKLIGNWHGD